MTRTIGSVRMLKMRIWLTVISFRKAFDYDLTTVRRADGLVRAESANNGLMWCVLRLGKDRLKLQVGLGHQVNKESAERPAKASLGIG